MHKTIDTNEYVFETDLGDVKINAFDEKDAYEQFLYLFADFDLKVKDIKKETKADAR